MIWQKLLDITWNFLRKTSYLYCLDIVDIIKKYNKCILRIESFRESRFPLICKKQNNWKSSELLKRNFGGKILALDSSLVPRLYLLMTRNPIWRFSFINVNNILVFSFWTWKKWVIIKEDQGMPVGSDSLVLFYQKKTLPMQGRLFHPLQEGSKAQGPGSASRVILQWAR